LQGGAGVSDLASAQRDPITGIWCAVRSEVQRQSPKGALKTQVLENASTGKGKYETAHFARIENACTENASTMQTFSQIKKFGTSQVSVVGGVA